MLEWIRSLLTGRRQPASSAPASPAPVPARVPTDEEIAIVEKSLDGLLQAGIVLGPVYDGMPLRAVATEIATYGGVFEGQGELAEGVDPPTWPLLVLWQIRDEEYAGFRNAALISDHCFDGTGGDTIARVVARVMDLSGAWDRKAVHAANADDPKAPLAYGGPIAVTITAEPAVSPFELTHGKDFDWRLIEHLNERLPAGSNARYLLMHDGGSALVVCLPRDRIEPLRVLLGIGADG